MIDYLAGDASALDDVAGLWEKIKAHHVACATKFAADMAAATFAGRKETLLKKAGIDGLYVDQAIERATDGRVGYCIASITPEHVGEIDSLFVDESHRGQGIGTELMHRALGWLADRGAKSTIIGVAEGNERALRFYARLGFVPRSTVLARPPRAVKSAIEGKDNVALVAR